jgi:hypothetical protein
MCECVTCDLDCLAVCATVMIDTCETECKNMFGKRSQTLCRHKLPCNLDRCVLNLWAQYLLFLIYVMVQRSVEVVIAEDDGVEAFSMWVPILLCSIDMVVL